MPPPPSPSRSFFHPLPLSRPLLPPLSAIFLERSPTVPFFPTAPRKCGIQQGFHGACGGAESAPVCRGAGVHRGNDAQIGRIISKTTTLCLQPSSCCRSSPTDPSRSHRRAALHRRPPFPLCPSLALSSRTVARDGIQPPLSAPPPNNHPTAAAYHGARRRVTESSDYYLICWHGQHATLAVSPAGSVDRYPSWITDHTPGRELLPPSNLSPRVQVSRTWDSVPSIPRCSPIDGAPPRSSAAPQPLLFVAPCPLAVLASDVVPCEFRCVFWCHPRSCWLCTMHGVVVFGEARWFGVVAPRCYGLRMPLGTRSRYVYVEFQ